MRSVKNQSSQLAHVRKFTTCVFVCTYSMHSRVKRQMWEVSEYFEIDLGDRESRFRNEVSSRCRSLCRYMSQHVCRCNDINSSSIPSPFRCALPLCMLALCRVIVNSFTCASHALTSRNVCCEKKASWKPAEKTIEHILETVNNGSVTVWTFEVSFSFKHWRLLGQFLPLRTGWDSLYTELCDLQHHKHHYQSWCHTAEVPLPPPPSPSLLLTVTQQLLLKIKSCCHFCLSLCEYEHMCVCFSVSILFHPLLPIVSSQYLRSAKILKALKYPLNIPV